MRRKNSFNAPLRLALLALCTPATSLVNAQPVTVDGFVRDPVTGVVEAPYTVRGITYTLDQVTGVFAGILYTAEDHQNLYFGFAQSVEINDNSYGVNAIGWDHRRRGHVLKDLLNSEYAQFRLYDAGDNLILDFKMDYATQDRDTGEVWSLGPERDGAILAGDPAALAAWGSSLAWNFNLTDPLYPKRLDTSPQRVPSNTYDWGTTADPNFPWIYELVYEFAIQKSAFGAAGFGHIEVVEVHNSPLKSATNPAPVPFLTVSKNSNPPSGSAVMLGDEIVYTIQYANTGLASFTDLVITDVVDLSLADVVPLDGGTFDESTRTVSWTIGTLAPGESGSVSFRATVDPIEGATNILNYATFHAPEIPFPLDTNTTEHEIIPIAILQIAKQCAPEASAGERTVYTLEITNLGDGEAVNFQVTDDYDQSLVAVDPTSISQGGTDSPTPGLLTWVIGSLPAGETMQLTYAGTFSSLLPASPTTVTNRASVADAERIFGSATSCSTTVTGPPDLVVSKTCPSEVTVGQRATYSITVANEGASPAENVLLVDELPPDVSFALSSPVPDLVDGHTLVFQLGNIGPGESVTVTVHVDVVAAEGSPENRAWVTTDSFEGEAATANNETQCASTILSPDLTVEKECPTLVAGEGGAYRITVRNTGTAGARSVMLTDRLPDEVAFVSAAPAPSSVDGSTLTFALGDLAPGGTASVTIHVRPTVNAGVVVNRAEAVTATREGGQGAANNTHQCESSVTAPDVAVSKACPDELTAGHEASYTVQVANAGNATAMSVILTDVLPPETVFVSSSPEPSSVSGRTLTFSLGNLPAGESKEVTITVSTSATGGTATNSASATTTSVEGGNESANNEDQCQSVVIAPDLTVSKRCAAPFVAGATARYELTVSNAGGAPAHDVVLTDTLPSNVEYLSAAPAPTAVEGGVLTFGLGTVDPGASVPVTIEVQVVATSGTTTNNASLTTASTEGGSGAANNAASCTAEITAPDLVVTKSCPAAFAAGRTATYTIQVSNPGGAPAVNVVLTDALPAEVAFVSAGASQGTITHDGTNPGGTVTASLGDIPAGASVTATIDVDLLVTEGTITNRVTATTDSMEGGQKDANNASTCHSAASAPDLVIAKSCPSELIAGRTAVYTVVVSNVGNASAANVVMTDVLPEVLNYTSASSTRGSVEHDGAASGGTVTANVGQLPAGESATITIEVTVGADTGNVVNEASVTTDSLEGGAETANNAAECDSGQILAPDIALTKTCPVDVVAGAEAAYTIAVTNAGTALARSVVVTDTLPPEVEFTSATPEPSSVDEKTLTFELGDLEPGVTRKIMVNAQVVATDGTAVNTAVATTEGLEGGAGDANNQGACSSGVLVPELSISQSCPSTAATASSASFVVEFANAGTADAEQVQVVNQVPAGFFQDDAFTVSATMGTVTVDGLSVTVDIAALAPGTGGTLTVTGTVTDAADSAGDFVNQAWIDSPQVHVIAESAATECTSRIIAPVLTLTKTAVITPKEVDLLNTASISATNVSQTADARNESIGIGAGATILYTMTYANDGEADADGVVLTDVLPAGVTFISASHGGTHSGGVVRWNLGTVAAGASGSVTVQVEIGQ